MMMTMSSSLTTRQPLWAYCVVSQRKGEKIEEIVDERKDECKNEQDEGKVNEIETESTEIECK